MHTLSHCPICNNASYSHLLSCKDYTVSQEIFDIVTCSSCGFAFTNPIPDLDKLGNYYKAESYVSHTSSKKGLINFLYNQVRKRTLKQKIKLVSGLVEQPNLLDFGCGTGHFLAAAKQSGFKTMGIEPDADARQFAIDKNQVEAKSRTEFEQLNAQFNVITLWHVLEHLPDLNKDIERLKNLLSDDGYLIIAVPNLSSFDAEYYKNYWAGYDLPRHLYHFSPKTIKALMVKHDLELKHTLPMKYDAYYVSMLSEKNKGGSVIKGFLQGLKSNKAARKAGDKWSSQIYVFRKA